MVAYNFQQQFVGPIESRQKTNTIRRIGKRRHARAGDAIQLYIGMRTKSCRKIIDPDPTCLFAKPISIHVEEDRISGIWIDYERIDDLEQFARDDGFESLKAMHTFWLDFHGIGHFEGMFIGWGK